MLFTNLKRFLGYTAKLIVLVFQNQVYAQDLELFQPIRYVTSGVTINPGVKDYVAFDWDIFTGDFPYTFRSGPLGTSVYTGLPLYFPIVISAGMVNQMAWFDDYSSITALSAFTLGYDLEKSWFAGAGSRWGPGYSGAVWNFETKTAGFLLGASLDQWDIEGHVSASLSEQYLQDSGLTLRYRFLDSWTLSLKGNWKKPDTYTISFGAGFSWVRYSGNLPDRIQIAHRGAMERAPENTGAALVLALNDSQFIGTEVDVQATQDGEFVLIHDDTLFRYTGELLGVGDLNLEALRERDFGSWYHPSFKNERVLKLEDLKPLVQEYPQAYWVLDLKNLGQDGTGKFLDKVHGIFPNPALVLLASGEYPLLQELKTKGYQTGLQADVQRKLFFWGDLVAPLLTWEIKTLMESNQTDTWFLLGSKLNRLEEINSSNPSAPGYFWNFREIISKVNPQAAQNN